MNFVYSALHLRLLNFQKFTNLIAINRRHSNKKEDANKMKHVQGLIS